MAGVRAAVSHEDRLMEKTAHYGWYLLRCGLTPEQVDRLPNYFKDRFPIYAQLVDEVEAEKAKPK